MTDDETIKSLYQQLNRLADDNEKLWEANKAAARELAEQQRQAILADEARKVMRRYTQPVYRFEVLYRPCPEVPRGTTAMVILTLSGKEQREELVYQGDGRWLNRDLVEWLSAPEDQEVGQ